MICLSLILNLNGIEIIVFKPTLDDEEFFHSSVVKYFEEFKLISEGL